MTTNTEYRVDVRGAYRRLRFQPYISAFKKFWNVILSFALSCIAGKFVLNSLDALRDETFFAETQNELNQLLVIIRDNETLVSSGVAASLSCVLIVVTYLVREARKRVLVDGSGIFYSNPNDVKRNRNNSDRFLLQHALESTTIKILGATGKQTFAREGTVLHKAVQDCRDLHVMLLNPCSPYLKKRAADLGMPWAEYAAEICYSIEFLKRVWAEKDNGDVQLRFYWERPHWKLVVLDKFIWVQQYCKKKHVRKSQCFAFRSLLEPKSGVYAMFDTQFYKTFKATKAKIGYYNFQSNELIYQVNGKRVCVKPEDILK